ncbi:ParA family protein [Streptomyces fractus]|uniref:ParA family protein n=1 Tax=Streptomyces fractus TaxID=641806 RepID=UPI003CE701CC
MIGTGKGGVGKSTVAAHYAASHAARGRSTLLVCVTSQDDDDLGIQRFGKGDQPEGKSVLDGWGLYHSLLDRTPLVPVREVRPNLDVVPGGKGVGEIINLLMVRMMQEGIGVVLALARALAPIAPAYDQIVIDSAPENDSLEQLAAAAARKLVVPTRSDISSIRGMERIGRNFHLVQQQVNSDLRVAGAFLYGSNPRATALHEQARIRIAELLGDDTPVLDTVVGYRETPATNARNLGLMFWEYAEMLPCSPKGYDVAAGRAKREDVVPESIVPLAKEMTSLAQEMDEYCMEVTP